MMLRLTSSFRMSSDTSPDRRWNIALGYLASEEVELCYLAVLAV